MRVIILSLVAALSLTTVAVAQPSKPKDVQKMAKDDCAKARAAGKTCVISFDVDTLEGDVPKGDGDRIDVIGFGGHGSLIRIRKDFIPEILKSAEDL